MSKVVLVVSDMIFRTKICSCAQAVGVSLEIVNSLDEFTRITGEGSPASVIVDLEQDEALVAGLIDAAAQLSPRPKLIGFCPHVRKDIMDHAKESGFDQVMPRSAFATNLPAILGEYAN